MHVPHADPEKFRKLLEKYADDPVKLAFLDDYIQKGVIGDGHSDLLLEIKEILRSENSQPEGQNLDYEGGSPPHA